MFEGNFTTGAEILANTNIPITQVFNTNNKIRLNNTENTVEILKNGLYKATIELSGESSVAGTTVAQLYADGQPIQGASSSVTASAVDDEVSFSLQKALRVLFTTVPNVVNISVRCDQDFTVTSGNIIVGYER